MKVIATVIPVNLDTICFYTFSILLQNSKARIKFSAGWWSCIEKVFSFLFIFTFFLFILFKSILSFLRLILMKHFFPQRYIYQQSLSSCSKFGHKYVVTFSRKHVLQFICSFVFRLFFVLFVFIVFFFFACPLL